jgi:hypothetical protein
LVHLNSGIDNLLAVRLVLSILGRFRVVTAFARYHRAYLWGSSLHLAYRPVFATQPPLFHAENVEKYSHQSLIAEYERIHGCRLVVVFDQLMPISVSFFEELIFDANREEDLHVMASARINRY